MRGTVLLELHALADARHARHFLCADDLAHEQDGWRANTAVRSVQKGLIRQELGTRGIGFLEVWGSVAKRVEQVRAAL
ncbi:hypothetical protein ACI3L1_02930 [Deinococcus sp. SM5_A1]|uniref:hypothetical protein n=1 Tax=Deinococcus sp. SM5_A1 TaxID=3379094 RepID=UPI00385E992B